MLDKYIKLFVAATLLFVASIPVHAATTEDYKKEVKQLQKERKVIQEKIEIASDKERIQLSQKNSELYAYEKAYNIALEYAGEQIKDSGIYSIEGVHLQQYNDTGIEVLEVGKQFINNSTYVFGGGRNELDISLGRFDCSSFIHWAFKQVGVQLGNMTSVTTDTLKELGNTVSLNNMQPGDLVFFDTYKKDGHVGIYAGNGKFLGAQGSTGVAFADMSSGYWLAKFNGKVKRIEY